MQLTPRPPVICMHTVLRLKMQSTAQMEHSFSRETLAICVLGSIFDYSRVIFYFSWHD